MPTKGPSEDGERPAQMSDLEVVVGGLSSGVASLASGIGEMRGEVRQNTAALNGIKVTLAKHGINGGARGITLSKPVAWVLLALVVMALCGAFEFYPGRAGEVVDIAAKLKPG